MAPTPVKSNRDAVKRVWLQGHRTAREISEKTGVPLRSCYRYIEQLQKTDSIPEIRRPGRPRKVRPEMRRQVGQIIAGNHFTTASEIKARLEETHADFRVGVQTIRDELFRLGYVSRLPRRVPLLTERAKANRLQWAQDHASYNWSTVVFSDETTFQLSRNTCLAWSCAGTPIAPMVKHPSKLHMWGAICARGKVGMCTFVENMDRHLYRRILDNNLYDQASNLYGRRHWVFQQDNDPKHTSKDVQGDLDRKLPRRVLPWPSYSPDFNPIENIWAILKKKVEKRVKKIIAQKKKVSETRFVALVEEEWWGIDDNTILSCIRSMPSRVQACITAKGGHTKY